MAEEKTPEPVRVPKLAMVLTAIAWFWTAYECDTIGIDVFDMLLKRFPGQLWIMAAVLTYSPGSCGSWPPFSRTSP